MVRIIDRVVDTLDLSSVEATFHTAGAGAPAYPPKMLLKLFVYGYLTRRFSSRGISQACREDLGFMWLARLEQPKHSVLAAFRLCHVTDLPQWLAQVIALCGELGMVGWQLGAVDGSKFRADASKHKAMSYGRMKEVITALEAELETLVAAHGAADAPMPASPTGPAESTDPEEDVRHEGDRVHPACRAPRNKGRPSRLRPNFHPARLSPNPFRRRRARTPSGRRSPPQRGVPRSAKRRHRRTPYRRIDPPIPRRPWGPTIRRGNRQPIPTSQALPMSLHRRASTVPNPIPSSLHRHSRSPNTRPRITVPMEERPATRTPPTPIRRTAGLLPHPCPQTMKSACAIACSACNRPRSLSESDGRPSTRPTLSPRLRPNGTSPIRSRISWSPKTKASNRPITPKSR